MPAALMEYMRQRARLISAIRNLPLTSLIMSALNIAVAKADLYPIGFYQL